MDGIHQVCVSAWILRQWLQGDFVGGPGIDSHGMVMLIDLARHRSVGRIETFSSHAIMDRIAWGPQGHLPVAAAGNQTEWGSAHLGSPKDCKLASIRLPGRAAKRCGFVARGTAIAICEVDERVVLAEVRDADPAALVQTLEIPNRSRVMLAMPASEDSVFALGMGSQVSIWDITRQGLSEKES